MIAIATACGESPPGPSGQSAIQVTASPSPVPLVVCPPEQCGSSGPSQFEIATTLTLRETGGVAGRVDSIGITLRRNSDSVVILNTTIAPASIQVAFGANGTAAIPFAMHVAQSDATAQTTATLVVNATDTAGRAVSATLTVPVGGPPTANGLFITGNYQIVQTAIATSCGDTGTPATVTAWVTLTGGNAFQLRDTGGTTFTGTVEAGGPFTANAVFGPDSGGQTYTQRLEGLFVSGAGFTGTLNVTVQPRNCAFTRGWTGTRL
jgi:hypothetical protein